MTGGRHGRLALAAVGSVAVVALVVLLALDGSTLGRGARAVGVLALTGLALGAARRAGPAGRGALAVGLGVVGLALGTLLGPRFAGAGAGGWLSVRVVFGTMSYVTFILALEAIPLAAFQA